MRKGRRIAIPGASDNQLGLHWSAAGFKEYRKECLAENRLETGMQKSSHPKTVLFAALISAVASFALYLPSLGFEFVNWDDYLYVQRNAALQGDDLDWAFTSVIASTWIPLTFLSYELDYSIWGLDPFGYHLSNSVLHAANSFLVAFIAARLAGARGGLGARAIFIIALSAGLLFGLHPLRVESVAWISERKDVLNAFFFLLCLLAYINYAASRKASSYIFALFFCMLSLLSKPMTVTVPLVLLILDYFPFNRFRTDGWRKPLLEKLPFLGLSLVVAFITILSQKGAMVPEDILPLDGRLHVAARAYLFYIYKTLLPVNLAPFYHRDFAAGVSPLFAVYVLALSAATALAFYMRKRSRIYFSAWAYFIITLLPVVGLLKVGRQVAADRYTYLPAISLALLVAAVAGWVVSRNRRMFAPALASIAVISALLSFLTLRQAAVWKDSISLWTHQTRLYPEQARGYVGRGKALLKNRKFEQALNDFDNAIEVNPFFNKEVYLLRGGTLAKIGRIEEGLADLNLFVTSNPRNKKAYIARGTAYALAGRYEDAQEDFSTALDLDPKDPSIHIVIGKVYMHMGDMESSYISMKRALELGGREASWYIRELEEKAMAGGNKALQTHNRW